MRYLLYLPGIILILLPILSARNAARRAEQARREQEAERAAAAEQRRFAAERKQAISQAKAAERERIRAAKEAERQRKQAARLEAARQCAEYAERELAAKRAAKALDQERSESIPAEPDQPAGPEQPTEPEQPAEPEQDRTAHALLSGIKGNNAFKGHVVAFTGRLPGMPRREAIQAVMDNGGRAYTKMPASTTILVVGDKPGMCKMDKADEWIGQVRKITAAQFFAMLKEGA